MTRYICDDADEIEDWVRWHQCIVYHSSLERNMSDSYTACEEKEIQECTTLVATISFQRHVYVFNGHTAYNQTKRRASRNVN